LVMSVGACGETTVLMAWRSNPWGDAHDPANKGYRHALPAPRDARSPFRRCSAAGEETGQK
jgi:hypothetical protein